MDEVVTIHVGLELVIDFARLIEYRAAVIARFGDHRPAYPEWKAGDIC